MLHLFQQGGKNLLLDSNSGSVHLVDNLAAEMILAFEQTPCDELLSRTAARHPEEDPSEIAACYDEIRALRDGGKLFTEDRFEDLPFEDDGVVKALCLHIAHACDLRCAYCFAAQGGYGGERALMPLDVGRRALDFLIESSGDRHNLEVDFFGGEPLLNFGVVKDLVAFARARERETGKHFRFTLTTNGMRIDDEIIDFVNREMDNVVLSLDGRREVHDRYRVDAQGHGSYDIVVPKFQKLVAEREKCGGSYYLRGTFTHANPDFLRDIEAMLELGFTSLSMEPVVGSPGDPFALTEEDIPTVLRQYEELAELMRARRREGRPFVFYHYMLDLEGGPCIRKRVSGCGSGTAYLAVTPKGDLYPCHRFVSEGEYRMGDVWSGITRPDLRARFAACNLYRRPHCRECWARIFCAGGCPAGAYFATGDIAGQSEQFCTLFRKRLECALYLAATKDEDERG